MEISSRYNFSNGVIEGIDKSIKVLKNITYGYKKFECVKKSL